MKKVKLLGVQVTERHAIEIIRLARKSSSVKDCPYKQNTHKWSIWMTSFLHKDRSTHLILTALKAAGVKII